MLHTVAEVLSMSNTQPSNHRYPWQHL